MQSEMLSVGTQRLKVVEWNSTQIIATDDSAICLTAQIIFDLKRKTVTALDIKKPEARGLNNACDLIPERQTYYLQEVANYYAQKHLAAARKSQTK
jgi:Iap family predicted aminopeptidase